MTIHTPNQPVLIVGMHRSGTSCLTGSLQSAGLNLGQVNTAAAFNKKGNREHEGIRDIHDELLACHGYSWDRPPPGQLNWRPLDLERLERKTEMLARNAPWGLKDPRTIFCINGWHQLFSPVFVATYRHPNAVANSLVNRAKAWGTPMDRDRALDLWVSYNRELLNITRDGDFPYIQFGGAKHEYLVKLRGIYERIGLSSAPDETFFTEEMVHETHHVDSIPEKCAKVWDALKERTA